MREWGPLAVTFLVQGQVEELERLSQTCGPRVMCALYPGGKKGAVTCFQQPTNSDEWEHVY